MELEAKEEFPFFPIFSSHGPLRGQNLLIIMMNSAAAGMWVRFTS